GRPGLVPPPDRHRRHRGRAPQVRGGRVADRGPALRLPDHRRQAGVPHRLRADGAEGGEGGPAHRLSGLRSSGARMGAAAAALAAVALVPVWIGGNRGFGLGTTAVIAVILALGYQVTYGFSGQLSVAHAPLQGIGAYAIANLTTAAGWSFWAALPVAVLVAAAFGAVVGLPGLRARGDVLALATLGAGEILQNLYLNTER